VAVVASACALAGLVSGGSLGYVREVDRRPVLGVVTLSPLVVRGVGFRSHERVTVSFVSFSVSVLRVAVASAAGSFRVSFGRPRVDRCEAYEVSARGARGSRAVLRPPRPLCPVAQPGGPTP